MINDADPLPSGSDLCLNCGLCCNGVIHDRALLGESEVAGAEAAGLQIEREPDRIFFSQPCARFTGTSCGIYELRPRTCRTYSCALLDRFTAGEVPFDEAIAIVGRAKAHVEQVRSTLPANGSLRTARAEARDDRRDWAERHADPEDRAQAGARRLALTILNLFVDRHFLTDRDRAQRAETARREAQEHAGLKSPRDPDRP